MAISKISFDAGPTKKKCTYSQGYKSKKTRKNIENNRGFMKIGKKSGKQIGKTKIRKKTGKL